MPVLIHSLILPPLSSWGEVIDKFCLNMEKNQDYVGKRVLRLMRISFWHLRIRGQSFRSRLDVGKLHTRLALTLWMNFYWFLCTAIKLPDYSLREAIEWLHNGSASLAWSLLVVLSPALESALRMLSACPHHDHALLLLLD